jgi:hypothetical protein
MVTKRVNSWSDVSLETYKELIDISSSDSDNKTFELISLLLDISMDEVESLSYQDFELIEGDLAFTLKPIKASPEPLVINNVTFHLIPFTNLEFGAFIDIEAMVTSKDTLLNDLPKIFSILFRRKVSVDDGFNATKYELYDSWYNVRTPLFNACSIDKLYYGIEEYMKFRNNLYDKYQGLFETKEELSADDIRILEEEKRNMTNVERKAEEKLERVNRWSWQLLLFKIANNDPLNIDKATEMPIIQALNILSMYHELELSNG